MANTFIFDDDEQPDMGGSLPGPGDDQGDESETGNRSTFTIVAIGIGVVILLALICLVGLAIFVVGPQRAAQSTSAAATQVQNNLLAQQTQQAALATPTLSATPILTDTPTNTPVLVFATDTPNGQVTQDPATATVEALQTQLANAQLTVTFQPSATGGTPGAGTRTGTPKIPQTGFADEFGLPGLFILALILLGVILLARRLRDLPAS